MQYIYRGNYGLISEEEIIATGETTRGMRARLMRLKRRFAFRAYPASAQDARCGHGRRRRATGSRSHGRGRGPPDRPQTCSNSAMTASGERADLNLSPFEVYECPYKRSGPISFPPRIFSSIIHCGEGDGWDIRRPSMGSIIVYQGDIYLIDAGPQTCCKSLTALGIGVNEIEGMFHTHCHDDHFAGLTTPDPGATIASNITATPPLVARGGHQENCRRCLGIEEQDFNEYFRRRRTSRPRNGTTSTGWRCAPVISPHPVETTVFFFPHADGPAAGAATPISADIVALDTLEAMVTDDPDEPGIDRAEFERIRDAYREARRDQEGRHRRRPDPRQRRRFPG